jgi:hypothetical protein
MKKVVNNRVCPNCEKRFFGCTCARTVANNGRVVHKTCKEEYEVKLKKQEDEKKEQGS